MVGTDAATSFTLVRPARGLPTETGAVVIGVMTAGPEALDVSAYWALSGARVHEFAQPIEIVIRSTAGGLVPATYDGSAWRVIHRVPTGGTLPAGWVDGFFTASDGVHVLTRHLSLFALLKDLEAPQAPQNVGAQYRPWLNDNAIVSGGVSVFMPRAGFKQILTGTVLYSPFVMLTVTY